MPKLIFIESFFKFFHSCNTLVFSPQFFGLINWKRDFLYLYCEWSKMISIVLNIWIWTGEWRHVLSGDTVRSFIKKNSCSASIYQYMQPAYLHRTCLQLRSYTTWYRILCTQKYKYFKQILQKLKLYKIMINCPFLLF